MWVHRAAWASHFLGAAFGRGPLPFPTRRGRPGNTGELARCTWGLDGKFAGQPVRKSPRRFLTEPVCAVPSTNVVARCAADSKMGLCRKQKVTLSMRPGSDEWERARATLSSHAHG